MAPPPPPAPPPQLALEDGAAGEGAPAAEEVPAEEAAELTLREQAVSLEHLLTHRIKNKYCPTCVRAKLHAKPARAKGQNHNPDEAPKAFGDQVTADHIIVSEEDKGRAGERAAIAVIDRATRWFGAYPVADKSADEAFRCLSHFAGPRDVVQSFYSDNSPELKRAALELRWPHPTSTPGRPDRNGVAERNVRVATEGARALLMHAGLPENWWPQAMAYMSVARNIESIEGLSPWESRFGGHKFQGPKIPFGALVDFKPSPVRGGPPKFAPKAVPGIFLGWVLLPGGKWKGDFLAAQLSTSLERKQTGALSPSTECGK